MKRRTISVVMILLVLLTTGALVTPCALAAGQEPDTVIASIPVGPLPFGLAYDSDNGLLYAAVLNASRVSVIDASTFAIVENVTVAYPNEVAFDPANGDIYVTGATGVAVIDGSTNTVVANLTLGFFTEGMAYDPANGEIYVARAGMSSNAPPPGVETINCTTNTVIENLPLGVDYFRAAYDGANGDVYLTYSNGNSGNVVILNGSNNVIVENMTIGPASLGVAYDPANGDVYVAGSNSVAVFDGYTDRLVTSVSVGLAPFDMAVDPVADDVYVGLANSSAFSSSPSYVGVIDGSTNLLSGEIAIGKGGVGSLAFDPSNGYLYVANPFSNSILVIPTSVQPPNAPGWVILAIPGVAVVFGILALAFGRRHDDRVRPTR